MGLSYQQPSHEPVPNHVPVAGLTNFTRGKPAIIVRVASVGEVRTWNNARGSGKLFSFVVADSAGDEIKVTAFQEVVDGLVEKIKEGRSYIISNFQIKVANTRFNTTPHEFEITFTKDTVLKDYSGPEADRIQVVSGPFMTLADVANKPEGESVDVIVVLKSKEPRASLMSQKFNKEIFKMDCVIADNSNGGSQFALTVWGKNVDVIERIPEGTVIAIKHGMTKIFKDTKSINTISNTRIHSEVLELPEASDLLVWASTSLSSTVDLSEGHSSMDSKDGKSDRKIDIKTAQDERLGYTDTVFVTILAWVVDLKPLGKESDAPLWYESCSECKKKLENGYCAKCETNREICYRFMGRITIQDDSGTLFCTAFDEVIERILSQRASHLADRKANDPDNYEAIIETALYKPFLFKIRMNPETYNDETRPRMTINGVEEADFQRESMEVWTSTILPAVSN
ncbi:hypothetical protein GEMRC1_011860 [Eukaryota sp. GEM-RC1]